MNREVQTDTKKVGQPDRLKDMNREGQKNRNREGQSDKNTQRSMDSKADLQTSKEKCGIRDLCEICRKRERGTERVYVEYFLCVCDV